MAKKSAKKKNKKYTIYIIVISVLAIIVSVISLIHSYSVRLYRNPSYDRTTYETSSENTQVTETEEIQQTSSKKIYNISHNTLEMKKADVYDGSLLLIDNKHEYKFADRTDGLVSVKEYKNDKYSIVDNNVLLRYEAITAFNELNQNYTDAILAIKDDVQKVMISSGYRSPAKQNSMYQNDTTLTGHKTDKTIFKPGCSENHTGYAIDLALYDGKILEYDGTGDFEWINKNCYKYGFVVSWKDEKSDITEMDGQPYHFRYVGIPHSYILEENNFCISEYIHFLKAYSFDNPYTATINNETYQIYYSPFENMEQSKSELPVPINFQYSVSGNNIDGFIVTIKGKYIQ
ncbi:MAG: D-alanyl-D-alanine carboxypeptidase family protein [Oscillospiraceae bacterium]